MQRVVFVSRSLLRWHGNPEGAASALLKQCFNPSFAFFLGEQEKKVAAGPLPARLINSRKDQERKHKNNFTTT